MDDTQDILAGGGDMGALARTIDWGATPLGPVSEWPQSLRTAVSIVLESKFGMMIAWGPDHIQFYNDRFRPILGETKHPAIGKSARDTFPEAWHIVGPLFEQVLAGNAVGFEDMLVPLDRYGYLEECYFTYSYSPIRDESGGTGGLLVTVTETTARLVADRRLTTLRDLAARTLHAHDETAVWRSAAEVLSENPADVPFALLYTLDEEGERARSIAPEATPLGPPEIALDDRDAPWPLGRVAAGREPVFVEGLCRRFGEHAGTSWPEPVDSALVLSVARPAQPEPYGFLVACLSPRRRFDDNYRDFLRLVADQIATSVANARAYAEERARSEALAELDRAKTVFFSNVSHELRTPLTLILGPVDDLLASGELSRAAHERLTLVRRNAVRLLKLVNALLDFSRIEAGRIDATFEPVDLATFTAELAALFRSAIERAGVRFVVDCPPLSTTVHVDRAMWEKIVLNLLSNALKFTHSGEIGVSLRADDRRATLSVRDTGVGIPREELPRLFERFHRAQTAASRSVEGSGIGLALVADLTRLHGGTVQVESEPGSGTTFTVSVPLGTAHLPSGRARGGNGGARPTDAVDAYLAETVSWLPGDAGRASEEAASSARVLLADDNADMRAYLERLLRPHYRVEAVGDGRAALEAARERRPDLVLTDVMMPALDGFGLLRELRADPDLRTVPVIVLSARAGEESAVEGLDVGADDYLVKPFTAQELLARVASRLELSARRVAVEEELREADRRKDDFLALLGHELRNPLGAIRNATELLALVHDPQDDELSRIRGVLDRQVRHATALIDGLLEVSRIARGKIVLTRTELDLCGLVARVVGDQKHRFDRRGLEVELRVPAESAPVLGDEVRLVQVFDNLLANAIKFTDPPGKVTVGLESDGDLAHVFIRDTGVGISPDLLERIFEPFQQEGRQLARSAGGLGLGLALVKALIELHGGSVEARSDGPGTGTEMRVHLPLASVARAP